MRYVHRIKREAEQGPEQRPGPELRQGELPLENDHAALDGRAETVERTATTAAIPQSCRDSGRCGGHPQQTRETAKPDWLEPYEALRRDWNSLIERVQQTGEPIFYAKGYADMMPRMQALADNRDIPAETRGAHDPGRSKITNGISRRGNTSRTILMRPNGTWAITPPFKARRRASIFRSPRYRIIRIGDRKRTALAAAGEAILSDKEAYAVHLDHILIGDTRLNWALSDLRETIRRGQRQHPRGRRNRNPGAPFPGANAPRERLRSPKQGPRVPPASVGRLPRIGRRAQSSTEGVRRLSSARVQTLHHARGKTAATTPRDIHEETQQQPSSPQTDEERRREAQSKAHEFRRLQSAAYNATGDERIAAQKAFDDYREREFKKNEKHEEKKRQTRKKSKGLRMRLQ